MNSVNKKSLFNFVMDLKHKNRSSPEYKKLLSLFIRDITERDQKYKITDLLKNTLYMLENYQDFNKNNIQLDTYERFSLGSSAKVYQNLI